MAVMDSDRIMFQIYRETGYNRKYKVVYFTELQERNREAEINRALAGEGFFDGFIRSFKKDQAKRVIEDVLHRLNDGETVSLEELQEGLAEYLA